MKRKILFSDVDGTFIDFKSNGVTSKLNIKTINNIQESGFYIAFISGLPKDYIKKFITSEVKPDFIMSCGGSQIWNSKDELIYNIVGLPEDWTILINEVRARKLGYSNINRSHPFILEKSCMNKEWTNYFKENFESVFTIDTNENKLKEIETNRNKIVIYGDVKEIKLLDEWIERNLKSLKTALDEKSGRILNISNIDSGKGKAVEWLINELDLNKKYTFSIGDGNNDIDMFETTAVSATFSDSSPLVKKVVTNVIERNKGIESFVKIRDIINKELENE